MTRRFAIALGLIAVLSFGAPPAGAAWTPRAATYSIGMTANVPITMRDGIVLRADVYFPTDAAGEAAPGPFPVLVSETPYDKQAASFAPAVTGYEPYLVSRGYIQAVVDVRGTGSSGGTFALFGPEEAADSVEVIRWASELEHASGKVGMIGESYLGIDQLFAAAAVGRGSPLKAIFPITASNDTYREIVSSGGILNIESTAPLGAVYGGLAVLTPAGELPNDPTALSVLGAHSGGLTEFTIGTYANVLGGGDRAFDEDYWQERAPVNVLERVVRNGIPAYLVGGLWDVYQEGEPLNYSGLQNAWAGRPVTAPMARFQEVTGRYQLLQKAAFHTTVDAVEPDLAPIKLAWFDRWLRDDATGIDDTQAPLHVVQVGKQRIDVPRYPLPQASPTVFHLAAGGALAAAPPADTEGADTIVFTGGSLPCDRSTEQWALGAGALVVEMFGLSQPCADSDVAPSSAGPGQLTYTTSAFARPTVLAGPIAARLYATATTTDSEWIVKLSDVAPDGSAVDLTQGALLGSFRALDDARTWKTDDGRALLPHPHYTRASQKPVVPGEVTQYDIDVRPTFATLQPGHRLRVTILTSQLPHLLPIPSQQTALVGGVYAVQRHRGAASSVVLPLAPASALGPNVAPKARAIVRRSGRRFRLDGRSSVDPDGRITSYRWTLRGHTISQRAVFTRAFKRAVNRVVLSIRDDLDASATTTVVVRGERPY